GRESSSSPSSKQELCYPGKNLKPNQVGEVVLYGIPIVSLVIDGSERLCLAQISNTLLKNYSYNEIHNRRVALGITCVQCTPVQLEILRRAGAMPISSRRCGMITKREAERLCKSFLGNHCPPKLPENFAFDVSHECAWGSRGSFIPARYNSSRAKCIKCSYCNMYFSPNKFIFHSHRTPESKYTQPDAANFNSWRRHLKLTDKNSRTDVLHAWEDVKAMFNGGSRKRTLPCSASGSSPPLNYPVIPVPSKGFGMLQKIPPPLFPHPYGFPAFGLCQKKDDTLLGDLAPRKISYVSAFRPVIKDAECIAKLYGSRGAYSGARTGYLSPDFLSESSSYRSVSPCVDSEGEPDVDVETNKPAEDEAEDSRPLSSPGGVPEEQPACGPCTRERGPESTGGPHHHLLPSRPAAGQQPYKFRAASYPAGVLASEHEVHQLTAQIVSPLSEDESSRKEEPSSTVEEIETKSFTEQSSEEIQREPDEVSRGYASQTVASFTNLICGCIRSLVLEELQKQLLEQVELRKRLEREFQSLKDNFQDQMKRELSYREEMVQQLHIVRGCDLLCNFRISSFCSFRSLCTSLIFISFFIEAHDALHHFSCKMLTPRHCSGSCSFKSPLLP
uniref:SKI family transcriptional corepressor 1b n=1 Tax=Tetraodon nigroviridis TaxID=99883 RepID=H3BXN8_TETNG